jgi:hypothetical protein
VSPRITGVRPLAGVEGGRITILGEGLSAPDLGVPAPRFDTLESRPLIAGPTRIIVPIPEDAVSGFLSVVWPEATVDGPYIEVARKLADELHPVANPVVDADGFILTTFSGSRGQAPPGGVSIFRIAPDGSVEPYVSDLLNPTGLALDASGILYVSCRNDGTIRKVTKPGQVDTVIEGLGIATGIAFDRQGNLFVGDRAGTVHVVDPEGSTRPFARLPVSVAAYHLAFGPDDHLYVTAPTLSNDDPVHRISSSGRVDAFVEHLARPQGLAFDRDGVLHVAAIFAGERGIFRIGADRRPELVVAGENLVGLAFGSRDHMVIAGTSAIYRLPWPLVR